MDQLRSASAKFIFLKMCLYQLYVVLSIIDFELLNQIQGNTRESLDSKDILYLVEEISLWQSATPNKFYPNLRIELISPLWVLLPWEG